MNIIVIHKARFERRPPVISVVMTLSDLGHNVTLIDEGVSDHWKKVFSNKSISYYEIEPKYGACRLGKLLDYLTFQRKTFKLVEKSDRDTLLWVEGAYTILALGNKLKNFQYVLQIQELHEKNRYQLRAISKVIHQAEAVFMPEYNRTQIYKVWFSLKNTPIVLPNKPYMLIDDHVSNMVLKQFETLIRPIKEKKIIIYQGGISRTRMLDKIAKAIKIIDRDYHLLLVGPEQEANVIDELKIITPEISHVEFLPSPNYLAFCKIAHIGFVFYAPESLNNLYCAPNKICEYSAFGLPMIANDIPGLRFTIGISGAAELVNPDDVDSIIYGLERIEQNYEIYRSNAIDFNNSIDNKKTIANFLNSL